MSACYSRQGCLPGSDLLGDRRRPRIAVEPVRLYPEELRHRLDLSARTPLVSLNACESGRRPPG